MDNCYSEHLAALDNYSRSGDVKNALTSLGSISRLFTGNFVDRSAFSELLIPILNLYAADPFVDDSVRISVLRMVYTVVESEHKKITELDMGVELTTILLDVVASTVSDNSVDLPMDIDIFDSRITSQQAALLSMGQISTYLPSNQVFTPLYLSSYLLEAQDPRQQYAAFTSFRYLATSYKDKIPMNAYCLIPWVLKGLKSGYTHVRFAALDAHNLLREFASVEMENFSHVFMSNIYTIMDDEHKLSQLQCRLLCDYFVGMNIKGDLHEIMPKLFRILRQSTCVIVQTKVIRLIGSLAETAETNFTYYLEEAIELLRPLTNIETTTRLEGERGELISTAFSVFPIFCSAVGANLFEPYLEPFVKNVMKGLNSKDEQTMTALCKNLDIVLSSGPQFGPCVKYVIPYIFHLLDSYFADGSDDFEFLMINRPIDWMKLLALLWKLVPTDPYMLPYFDASLDMFTHSIQHYSSDIRSGGIVGLWVLYRIMPNNLEVQAAAWEAATTLLRDEEDVEVVTALIGGVVGASKSPETNVFPDEETVEIFLGNVFRIVGRCFDVEFLRMLLMFAIFNYHKKTTYRVIMERILPFVVGGLAAERQSLVAAIFDISCVLRLDVEAKKLAHIVQNMIHFGEMPNIEALEEMPRQIEQCYETLFEYLGHFVEENDDDTDVIEKAAGAFTRVAALTSQNDAELVSYFLDYLPLRSAFEEYPSILRWLASVDIPPDAKPIFDNLWDQHIKAKKNGERDPLEDETALEAFNEIRMSLLKL